MTEVASKVFPTETLREFCIRVFLHCGVPQADATQAADVPGCADLRGVDSHSVAGMYSYFAMLSEGHIHRKPKIKIVRSTPSTAKARFESVLQRGSRTMHWVLLVFARRRSSR